MPVTQPGDGMPRDEGARGSSATAEPTNAPPPLRFALPVKAPRGVPTFAASGGFAGPRLLAALLAVVLLSGLAAGLFDENQPPANQGNLVEVSQAPASPAARLSPAPEPTEDGPRGATIPATPTAPTPPLKAAAPTSVPPEELTGFQWPLRGARVTSRFAPRSFGGFVIIDGEEVHDGLDLARFCGFKVRAAHDGTVLYAGRKFDDYIGYWGSAEGIYSRLEKQGRLNTLPIVVVIDYGNGYRGMYVHLSKAEVEAGDVVKAGDVIGREGATGFATGCHLHYTLIRMDGPWQPVAPHLQQYGYPAMVRQRVDPLLVLPWDDQHAPERLRQRVAPSASPESSPGVSSPSPGATPSAQPAATP